MKVCIDESSEKLVAIWNEITEGLALFLKQTLNVIAHFISI